MDVSTGIHSLPSTHWWVHRARRVALSSAAFVCIGCSGDTTGPAILPATQLYTALTLTRHAITLALTAQPGQALYDTVQLAGVAYTAAGTSLALGDRVIQYSALDSSITVSPTGLVTAHYVTNSAQVIASLTLGGVTHTDTAVIRVAAAAFTSPLATLSIQPLPNDLDSAADALDDGGSSINNGRGNIPVYATTLDGDSVCSNTIPCQFAIHFSSSNPQIAKIDQNGIVTPIFPGAVWFTVDAEAFGVTKRDSLLYIIGYPIGFTNLIDIIQTSPLHATPLRDSFYPAVLKIGVGGLVGFTGTLTSAIQDSIDVVFDDSSAVINGGTYWVFGNGPDPDQRFPTSGLYAYHSQLTGARGAVQVISNRDIH